MRAFVKYEHREYGNVSDAESVQVSLGVLDWAQHILNIDFKFRPSASASGGAWVSEGRVVGAQVQLTVQQARAIATAILSHLNEGREGKTDLTF